KNQLHPGPASGTTPGGTAVPVFDFTASGGAGGPNYTLRAGDFPFFRLADPSNRDSAVLFSSDDVAGSAGVLQTTFNYAVPGDESATPVDSFFHVGTAPY